MSEELNTNEPSKGLGDTIAKVTHALGIDKVAEKVANALGADDCGCQKRREALNNMFPYNQPAPPPTIPTPIPQSDYEFSGERVFEVIERIIVTVSDESHTYEGGDKVMISSQHILYPSLKYLLENNRIKLYKSE